jgi:hypothetical protein
VHKASIKPLSASPLARFSSCLRSNYKRQAAEDQRLDAFVVRDAASLGERNDADGPSLMRNFRLGMKRPSNSKHLSNSAFFVSPRALAAVSS